MAEASVVGFRDLAAHPLVIGALDRVLGDHATSFQLHLTQVIEIGAGEPAQFVHRDQWAFDFFEFPTGFEVECHTMWAMDDFTEENGATRVIPGSNHWADKLRPTADETIAAEMPKGSVLLYLGSLYHGGGANRSTRRPARDQRRLHALVAAPGGEPIPRVPAGCRARVAGSVARLAGYQRGAYALGYYGDLRDPFESLHGPSDARRASRTARERTATPSRSGSVWSGADDRPGPRAALRFLADDGLVRVTAAADPDLAGVERVAKILGGIEHTGTDCYAVIDDDEVDTVVNITPTRFHHDYIAAIARAGKPCFAEKPLAPTFAVVLDIVKLVHEAGIPVQVGFQSRFHPLVRRLAMVESAEAGAPMAYTLRDDEFWPTGGVVEGHSNWRSDRAEAGGGALLEHSIHSCDILGWMFGPVERVYATTRSVFGYNVEDVAALTIEHRNGVVGNLVTVFNGVQHREERRLEVFFEAASVELTSDFIVGAPEDSFLVHRADEEHAERYDVNELRRAAFAAEGFDPDRQVFVYQYFSHHAFATAFARAGRRAPT